MSDQAADSPRKREANVSVPHAAPARRGFFAGLLAGTIGLLLGLIPTGLGLGFFLDPLLRRQRDAGDDGASSSEDAEGFVRLAIGVSALPADGTPIAYTVKNDKTDAWNRFRDVEIGTVWLRRLESDEVLALSSICPHLGCAVDYRGVRGDFFCPCHTSAFRLDGERINDIPPRGMDRLETRLKPETGDIIWLKYQNFRATTPEKIPVS